MALKFKTELDDSHWIDALFHMERATDKFVGNTERKTKDLDKNFGGASGASGALGWATLLAAAGAKAGAALIDYGSAIKDASDATSLGVEQFQRLQFAFGQSGTKSEQFTTGMQTLASKLQDARDGNDAAIKSFGRLGVSIDDIKGGDVSEVLLTISDGAKNATDKTEMMASVMDVLGKAGKKMIPGLTEGRDAIEKLGQSARIVAERDIAELDKAGDRISKAWTAIKSVAASGLAVAIRGPDLGDRDNNERLEAKNKAVQQGYDDEAKAERELAEERLAMDNERAAEKEAKWKKDLARAEELDKFERSNKEAQAKLQEKLDKDVEESTKALHKEAEEGQEWLAKERDKLAEKSHKQVIAILDKEKDRRLADIAEVEAKQQAAQQKLSRDTGEAVRKGLMSPQERRDEKLQDKRVAREERRVNDLTDDARTGNSGTRRGTRSGDAKRAMEIAEDKRDVKNAKDQLVKIDPDSIQKLVDKIEALLPKS